MVDVFIEPNLSSSLSISPCSLSLSTTSMGDCGVGIGRIYFPLSD